MKEFPPIKGTLDIKTVDKIKDHFKWNVFNIGLAKVSVTKHGGVHYTGKVELKRAITFEVTRRNIYITITLQEYPKGIIFHTNVYYPHINRLNKEDLEKIVLTLYSEVKNVIDES